MNIMKFNASDLIEFANLETNEPADKGAEIEFRAPTYNEMTLSLTMEGHLMRAFQKAGENDTRSPAEKAEARAQVEADGLTVDADEVIQIISMYGDLPAAIKDFEKLAVRVGKFNEETPFVLKHFKQLSIPDIKRLMGEYLAFFIAPSVLS